MGAGLFLKKNPRRGGAGECDPPERILRYGHLLHSRGGDQAPAAQADGEEALAFFRVLRGIIAQKFPEFGVFYLNISRQA